MVTDKVESIASSSSSSSSAAAAAAAACKDDSSVVPTLRLCQLISWPSYAGYGFDVVTDQRQSSASTTSTAAGTHQPYGHFIGRVVISFISTPLHLPSALPLKGVTRFQCL